MLMSNVMCFSAVNTSFKRVFQAFFVFISLIPLQACAQTDFQPIELTAIPKIIHEEYRPETVTIASREYDIPPLWQGKRIYPATDTASRLQLVPRRFVVNQGQIYLREDACNALTAMAESAEKDGVLLLIDSGYRSIWYQKKIYQRKIVRGKTFEEIAKFVAPPGYSEHSLGCAADFSPSNWRFAGTVMYRWLQENGGRFGFVETYPKNNPGGEPWEASHWCYHPLQSEDVVDNPR